jgi:hypothetical protein
MAKKIKQVKTKSKVKTKKTHKLKKINTSIPINKVVASNGNKDKNVRSKVLANVLEANTKIRQISLFEFNEIVVHLIQKAKLRKRNRNTLE